MASKGSIQDLNLGCPAPGPPLLPLRGDVSLQHCKRVKLFQAFCTRCSSVYYTLVPTLLLDNFSSSFGFPRRNFSRAANTTTILNHCPLLFSIIALCSFPRSFPYQLQTQNFICKFWYIFMTCSKYLLSLLPDPSLLWGLNAPIPVKSSLAR